MLRLIAYLQALITDWRSVSSAGEHHVDIVGVTSSILVRSTICSQDSALDGAVLRLWPIFLTKQRIHCLMGR